MKKQGIIVIIMFICCLLLCSCGYNDINYDLPEDPIVFEDTNESEEYLIISYNGRKYVPYGTLKGYIDGNDIEKCVGYYVQDENSDQNDRVCTLANDPDCNFLMSYYISGIMELHMFYRAIDTKGVDIEIPDFIDPSGYEYWE